MPLIILSFMYVTGCIILCLSHESYADDDKVFVCYLRNISIHNHPHYHSPSQIDPFLCTHLIYISANYENYKLVSLNPQEELTNNGTIGLFSRLTAFKEINSNLKILISINFEEESTKFTRVQVTRRRFISSVIEFLREHNFDGLEVWSFPNMKDTFRLLEELKTEFKNYGYILTSAVRCNTDTSTDDDGDSDLIDLNRIVDWTNYHCYHHVPFYERLRQFRVFSALPFNNATFNIERCVRFFLKHVPRNKLVLTVSNYGLEYIKDEKSNKTEEDVWVFDLYNWLPYNQVCYKLKNEGWTDTWDESTLTPIALKGGNRISYDNEKSMKLKAKFAVEQKIRGMGMWFMHYDDILGVCSQSNNVTFPHHKVIREELGITNDDFQVFVEDFSILDINKST